MMETSLALVLAQVIHNQRVLNSGVRSKFGSALDSFAGELEKRVPEGPPGEALRCLLRYYRDQLEKRRVPDARILGLPIRMPPARWEAPFAHSSALVFGLPLRLVRRWTRTPNGPLTLSQGFIALGLVIVEIILLVVPFFLIGWKAGLIAVLAVFVLVPLLAFCRANRDDYKLAVRGYALVLEAQVERDLVFQRMGILRVARALELLTDAELERPCVPDLPESLPVTLVPDRSKPLDPAMVPGVGICLKTGALLPPAQTRAPDAPWPGAPPRPETKGQRPFSQWGRDPPLRQAPTERARPKRKKRK
jgi:hypothetical protein